MECIKWLLWLLVSFGISQWEEWREESEVSAVSHTAACRGDATAWLHPCVEDPDPHQALSSQRSPFLWVQLAMFVLVALQASTVATLGAL